MEAFFSVHAAPTQPDDKKKVQQKETRQEQLAHIQEEPVAPSLSSSQANSAAPSEGGQPDDAEGGSAAAAASETAEPKAGPSSAAQKPESPVLSEDTQKFLAFAETHRTVLNQVRCFEYFGQALFLGHLFCPKG